METILTFVESDADERSFMDFHVQRIKIGGAYQLEKSYFCYDDRIKNVKKKLNCSRIIQIEIILSDKEILQYNTQIVKFKRAVVYFHKCEFEGDWLAKKRHIGVKPFGQECFLIEDDGNWTKMLLNKSKKIIIVPTSKILNVDIQQEETNA